jgi:hypothetical protein
LVVNGFDRISAPLHIQGDSLAGFYNSYDSGVAYIRDISFTGEQRNFDRSMSRSENDNIALGSSYSDYETEVIAGNTFDYTTIHGAAITAAGFSYCSASVRAVERGQISLEAYPVIDLILGKQRTSPLGRGTSGVEFEAFPDVLQEKLRAYTSQGGALMASGSYVASDLWNGEASDGDDREFARRVLHISFNGDMATRRGTARIVASPMQMARLDITFNREYSRHIYAVESPGCITPFGRDAFIAMRYPTNNQVAAVGYKGTDYRTFIMAFPFETITDATQRESLMRGILNFLSEKTTK